MNVSLIFVINEDRRMYKRKVIDFREPKRNYLVRHPINDLYMGWKMKL